MDQIVWNKEQIDEFLKTIRGESSFIKNSLSNQVPDVIIGHHDVESAAYRGLVIISILKETDFPQDGAEFFKILVNLDGAQEKALIILSILNIPDGMIPADALSRFPVGLDKIFVVQMLGSQLNEAHFPIRDNPSIIMKVLKPNFKPVQPTCDLIRRDAPIPVMFDIDILHQLMPIHIYLKNEKVANISTFQDKMVPSIYVSCLLNIPAYNHFAESIVDFMKANPAFYQNTEIKHHYLAQQKKHIDDKGYIGNLPEGIILFIGWFIIQCSLKKWTNEKSVIEMSKSLKAVSNILDLNLESIRLPSDFAEQCMATRPHIIHMVPELTKLFTADEIPGENANTKKVREHVGVLLSGWEMSAFMAIKRFMDVPIKCRAHVIPNILDQMDNWEVIYRQVCVATQDKPLWYKLLNPNSQLIRSEGFLDLKYLAVAFMKRVEPKTWGKFAGLATMKTNIPRAFLDAKLLEPIYAKLT